MILHCSGKLAKRMPETKFQADSHEGFASWHGHLAVFDRRQCLFFCHNETRFMLVFPGVRKPELGDLSRLHRSLFAAVLEFHHLPKSMINSALLATEPVSFSNKTDRSVMGSIRTGIQDFEYGLWHRVPNVMDLHPIPASAWLNGRPTSIRGKCVWPRDEIYRSIETLVTGRQTE